MGGFSELIKNFDKTRDYVRDFFIYGFKTRGEFKGKSARTYDDEKRRVESWLGGFISSHSTERGKQTFISVDCGHITENPLYNAFYSKSFTDNDIKLHFMLCDILSDGGQMSVRDITECLNERYSQLFDEQTVRGKLREYTDEGIFRCERVGKSSLYSMADCSISVIDDSIYDIRGLSDAVKFFSENSEFGVIGNSILKTAGLKNDIFLRKHNYIVHTLEDEILLAILSAIEDKRFITVVNKNGKSEHENRGVPLKILVSTNTGRRYAVLYLPSYKRFNSFRLDSIKSVKVLGECAEYDRYAEKLENNLPKVYGVSFGDRQDRESDGGIVKITFFVDEQREGYIVDRLNREKRGGTIERAGDNLYTYSAEVFDANEMMTWVKTFIGRIVSFEGMPKPLEDRFKRDIIRMKKMYSEKGETGS